MTGWPSLRVADWRETRDALHLWSQVVGKVKLAKTPLVNHFWNVTLVVSARGLTTGAIPEGTGTFEIEFDFVEHRVRLDADGRHRDIPLRSMSVATFYAEMLDALRALGIDVVIRPVPVEVETAVPFEADDTGRRYDRAHAHAFWRQLVQAHRVMSVFRAGFVGKVSPVHFFWGSFDMAVTRFSGRSAPPHPGGVPNCPDWVMAESYSRELSSCGFWPGGGEEGAFYAYAYPEPAGFAQAPVHPAQAAYAADFGQFLLPYEAVRQAPDPDATLLAFFQDTYRAAAERGDWDPALTVPPGP